MKKRNAAPAGALRTWGLYLLALTAWVTVVILLAFLSAMFFGAFVWQPGPAYDLLNWLGDNVMLVGMVAVLAGWIAISWFFIARPARRLEAVADAAGQLARPSEAPIVLPGAPELERKLNAAREQALADARAARDAEQRKNDLVLYLAHDLKTPLTSVIGYLTLLRDEPQLSPELRARYTSIALDKALRLEDLVNEFFDITRFSLSRLELTLQPVDLRRLLEQMVSEFAPVLRERDMACTPDLPEPFRVVGDPDKLARVFDNLLSNACHYGDPGTEITLTGRMDGGTAVVTFANRGPTIPPEKLERMFEQFFRLDGARSTGTGSAGLGLAIARALVQAHGGTVTAASADGRVVFTVRLPAGAP